MFALLPDQSRSRIEFTFEGRTMQGRAGDTLAAALLCNGVETFRQTAVTGADHGPFCMMGVCFECLVEVDGRENRQACLTPLQPGMNVRRQRRGVTVGTP